MPIFLSLFLRCVTIHLHYFKFYNSYIYFLKHYNMLHIPHAVLKHLYSTHHFNINLFVNMLELFYVFIQIYNNYFVSFCDISSCRNKHVQRDQRCLNNNKNKSENNEKIYCTNNNGDGYDDDGYDDDDGYGEKNVSGIYKENNNKINVKGDIYNIDNINVYPLNGKLVSIYLNTLKEILKECYECHLGHMKNNENMEKSFFIEHLLLYFLYNRINTIYELFYNFYFTYLRKKENNNDILLDIVNEHIYNLIGNKIYDQINKINNFLDDKQYYYFYINTLTFITLNKQICIYIIKKKILNKLIYIPFIYHSLFDKNKNFTSIYHINNNQYIRNKDHIIFCSLIVFIIKLLYVFVKNFKHKNVNFNNHQNNKNHENVNTNVGHVFHSSFISENPYYHVTKHLDYYNDHTFMESMKVATNRIYENPYYRNYNKEPYTSNEHKILNSNMDINNSNHFLRSNDEKIGILYK